MGEKYLLNQRGDKKLQANKVLQKIEIGTVINVISPFLRNTAYHKENIIKVGNDNYFAQGLGVGVLSFRQVINGLVDKAIQYQLINESQRKKALEAIYVGTVIEWDLIVK